MLAPGISRAEGPVQPEHSHDEDEQVHATADDWRTPNRLRTAVMLGAIVAVGTAWYWIDRDRQVGDWDFPSWSERFSTDILIHDTNPFEVNYSWHTFGGTWYHVIARSNDLGVVESALWGLGASLAWEYGIEYREKADINDIIFTTPAGVSVGEFFHWLGRYLQQAPSGPGWDALRWTLGIPQTIHDRLDGRDGARGPAVAHEFAVSSGVAMVGASRRESGELDEGRGGLAHLRLSAKLSVLDRAGGFRDGNLTSISARFSRGTGGDAGSFFLADTVLAGWRRTGPTNEETNRPDWTLDVGTSVGVRYQRESYGPWLDRLGLAHLPGLAVDGERRARGWRLAGTARLHLDYGGIHALSSERWHRENPDEVGKSILSEQGYYYAWGGSARLAGEVSTGWGALGAGLFYGRYRSQQGFDRFASDLTLEQTVTDRFLDYDVWLRGHLPGSLFVEARASGHHRRELLEELRATASLGRYGVELGTMF